MVNEHIDIPYPLSISHIPNSISIPISISHSCPIFHVDMPYRYPISISRSYLVTLVHFLALREPLRSLNHVVPSCVTNYDPSMLLRSTGTTQRIPQTVDECKPERQDIPYRYGHLPYRYGHLMVIFHIDTVIFRIDTVIFHIVTVILRSSPYRYCHLFILWTG